MELILDFLIAPAYAQDAQAPGAISWLFPIGLIVVFYFLLIRPQQKRQKEHQAMVSGIAVGDEIVSGGGLLGKVTAVSEQFITVDIAENVSVKLQKHTVSTVLPKGTIKSA